MPDCEVSLATVAMRHAMASYCDGKLRNDSLDRDEESEVTAWNVNHAMHNLEHERRLTLSAEFPTFIPDPRSGCSREPRGNSCEQPAYGPTNANTLPLLSKEAAATYYSPESSKRSLWCALKVSVKRTI
jgi:hypothetical protein